MRFSLYVLLAVIIHSGNPVAAQTLTAGDIAIIGYNTDDPDGFSFVTLTDIPEGEVVVFTDEGWNTTDWSNTVYEGSISWQPGTGGLACGSVVTIEESAYNSFSVSKGIVNFSGVTWSLWDGDQILVYQGPKHSPVFITALHADYDASDYHAGTSWNANGGAFARSTIPPGLSNGVDCISLYPSPGPELDNAAYNGSLTGSPDSVRAWIMDPSNWDKHDFISYDISSSAYPAALICGYSCTAPGIPVVHTSSTEICMGDTAVLSLSGALNGANSWEWYAGGCGGDWVGSGDTLKVSPASATNYFARAEGGCISAPGNCGSLELRMDDNPPEITCPSDQVLCSELLSALPPLNLEDNCTTTLTYTLSGATTGSGAGEIESVPFQPGTTLITYLAEDLAGNTASCAFELTYSPIVTEVISSNEELNAQQSAAVYQWLSCSGPVFEEIPGALSQTYIPTESGTFAVVISSTSCTDTSDCHYFELATGTDVIDNVSIVLYPNPLTDLLYVEGIQQIDRIQLLDPYGRILIEATRTEQLDVSDLLSGTYFVVIESQGLQYIFPVVKL